MLSTKSLCLWLFVAAAAATVAGCSSQAGPDPSKVSPTGKAQGTAASSEAAQAEATPGLAELSPEDRAAAEKQRVCPVSGELLGGMGKPYKVTVKDQTFFLCCSGCEEELKKDPDKFLAILKTLEKK